MNQTASSYYFHQIDPVAFEIFGFAVYWYSLMYLVAFGAFWLLGRLRARREDAPLSPDRVGDLLFWGVLGVVVGGRLGYVLFYGLDQLLADPLFVFRIRDGGMSFHGGLIGVIVAIWAYGRHLGCGFLRLADFVAPLVPLGLAAGRLGNFIGGELWGRKTDVPWAMIFPSSVPADSGVTQTLYQQYLSGALDEFARHPPSSTRQRWKGWPCSSSCGCSWHARARPERWAAHFWWVTRCFAVSRSFSANPTRIWASWPSTGSPWVRCCRYRCWLPALR